MLQKNQSVENLCEAISRNTQKVANYLRNNGLPFPSFDTDAPSDSLIPPEEAEIRQARMDVINDTHQLRQLMLGPRDFLQSLMVSLHCCHST